MVITAKVTRLPISYTWITCKCMQNDNQQTGLLNFVKIFSDDIKMEFGLEKCAKASFKGGKLVETLDLQLYADTTCIKELDQEGHIQIPWNDQRQWHTTLCHERKSEKRVSPQSKNDP